MKISELCDKIELQPQVKEQVLSFAEQFDFKTVDKLLKSYHVFEDMEEALKMTRDVLGDDPHGFKILACMLKASADAYELYREKGIDDEIYVATMKCYPRFIEETYRMTGELCYDREWWTTRQAGCHLYRIGDLEYEILPLEQEVVISIHIPSDAVFTPLAIDQSLQEAYEFFAKHYPLLDGAEYRCQSWLLDGQIKDMLGETSNIVSFQNRFEIFEEGKAETGFLEWLFHTKSGDYEDLAEDTSLQRKVKGHLLAGGVLREPVGRLKIRKYTGRKPIEVDEKVLRQVNQELKDGLITVEEAMRRTKIGSKSTFYRKVRTLKRKSIT